MLRRCSTAWASGGRAGWSRKGDEALLCLKHSGVTVAGTCSFHTIADSTCLKTALRPFAKRAGEWACKSVAPEENQKTSHVDRGQ
jgi:hypothetical protein